MLILLLLMALALAAGCWAYSYVWRGLNRRVIAAVKVVDPMITLGPYVMAAWVAFMALIATNIWATGTLHTVLTIIFWVVAAGCLGWSGFCCSCTAWAAKPPASAHVVARGGCREVRLA